MGLPGPARPEGPAGPGRPRGERSRGGLGWGYRASLGCAVALLECAGVYWHLTGVDRALLRLYWDVLGPYWGSSGLSWVVLGFAGGDSDFPGLIEPC